jgi:uncharacterized integral membrane protein
MPVVRNFFLILVAALGSSILGALFAAVVALVSPEFIRTLFSPPVTGSVTRYAAGVGMVWGLFLGTAVMGFSLLIGSLAKVTRALEARREGSRDERSAG